MRACVLFVISCGILASAQSQSSGMIGVAVNQTARLNVQNTAAPLDNPVAIIACPVTLQIFDDQNTKLAEMNVDNVAPLTSAHLDFGRPTTASSTTPLRVQVRGVAAVPFSPGGGTVIPVARVAPICTFSYALEVFDTDTGKTRVVQTFTSFVPLAAFLEADAVAQPLQPTPANLPQTQGSGMIGVAINQTARLNVLNTATPPTDPTVTVPACKVTLQIFDDQNTKLAEMAADNVAPSSATHLDFVRPSTATPLRIQVRGIATVSLTLTGIPMPTVIPIPLAPCSLASTLEVFDNDTGKTQVVLPVASSAFAALILDPLISSTP